MNRWPVDRARSLLLALVLGLGMSLWPVHGGTMATTIAADAAQAGSDHCPGCEAGAAAGDQLMCQMVCGPATLPLVAAGFLAATAEAAVSRDPLRLRGQARGLDPGPPKHHPHPSDA